MLFFSVSALVQRLFCLCKMAVDQSPILFLLLVSLLLPSCGGSGSSGSNVVSVSSSSSSSVVMKTASDYAMPQAFEVMENQILSGQLDIKIANPLVRLPNKKTGWFGDDLVTANGGQVRLVTSSSGAAPSFSYTPQEEFYGEDEFTYFVSPQVLGAEDITASVKVSIKVIPSGDEPRVRLLNSKVFSNSDLVELTHFFRAVSGKVIAPDATTTVFLDGAPLPLEITADKILVKLNDFQDATLKKLIISQMIDGQQMQKEIAIRTKVITPDYEIYQGKLQAPGVTVAVMFDNDELPEVIDVWKKNVLTPFADMSLQKKYLHYFSLVLIKKTFPNSFAPNKEQFLGDNLHASIDEVIFNHTIAVGIGRRVNGGWASGNTIGIDSAHGINTFVHELGHANARLSDEYEPIPKGICGVLTSPNASYENTADTVPWSHWIVDKVNVPGLKSGLDDGVGIYTGAWCERANRPLFNSVMRGGSDMGPIFTEAWGLSLYEKLGFLASIKPQLLTGKRRLEIKGSIDQQVTDVQWYMDGVLQTEWNNQTLIEVDEAVLARSTYTIAAKLVDKTGFIRNANAYLTFNNSAGVNNSFYREWTFQQAVDLPTANSRFQKPEFTQPAAYDCPAGSHYCRQ